MFATMRSNHQAPLGAPIMRLVVPGRGAWRSWVMRVRIGYGLEHAEYDVPEGSLIGTRREPSAPPIADLVRAVHDALETPLGFPALRKAVTPDDHVVIVADNYL